MASRNLGQIEPYLTVREIPLLAWVQMACSGSILAVLAGSGLLRQGLLCQTVLSGADAQPLAAMAECAMRLVSRRMDACL